MNVVPFTPLKVYRDNVIETSPNCPFWRTWKTSSYPGWIKSPYIVTLGILKISDLDSLTIFSGGGYSGVNFGHPKSEVFQNGGYSRVNFGHPNLKFSEMGGVFQSKLWSSQIWSFLKWGGYSGVNFGHPKSEVFQNGGGGGGFRSSIPERGKLENLDQNLLFSQKPACASQ